MPFRAVADPVRRAILDQLRGGGRRVGEIAARFPVSRPAISQHLRVLREAGLVGEERRGRCRVYHLQPAPLAAIDRWLARYRAAWERDLASLKAFVEAEEAWEARGEAGGPAAGARPGREEG